jgi:hypothetical protein
MLLRLLFKHILRFQGTAITIGVGEASTSIQ